MAKLLASVLLVVGAAAQCAGFQESAPGPAQVKIARFPYKVMLVQAAPGKLTELIGLYKQQFAADASAGEEAPLWMRHSQGDRWDLMILEPMTSYAEFFSRDRMSRRAKAEQPLATRIHEDIAWQEDLYCTGPAPADLRRAFADGGFFHVEMFVALAGHFDDLYREREMENAYARGVKQPENFIFVRDSGASWDLFTIGVFRDLKHYAESANLTPQQQDTAAKAAGFESASQIGPYLRRFISTHHDTLALAIK